MKKLINLLISLALLFSIAGCGKNIAADGGSKDSLKLQMENKNFKFYSFDKDRKCLDNLAKALDENYNRISQDLKVTLKDKTEVEIYPDIKAFHAAAGEPDAPEWYVGTAYGNKIKMVSPLNPGRQHTYDTLMQVIVHEFTHIAANNINSNLESIPIWLSEGIATYEAEQMSDNGRKAIKEKADKNDIPSLSKMTSANFSELGGYQFSYTAAEYIVKEYGYGTVIALIEKPADLEKILGVSMTQFENDWKAYLKESYR